MGSTIKFNKTVENMFSMISLRVVVKGTHLQTIY